MTLAATVRPVRRFSGISQTQALDATSQFLDALWSVSQGNCRAIWLPTASDTTTNTERTYPNRVWTYDASIAARISTQGSGVLVTFGSNQYARTPDTADMSFNTGGLTDLPFSLVVLANITDTAGGRALISKYSGAPNGEWLLYVNSADKLGFQLRDHSAAKEPFSLSNAAITMGASHLFGGSYSGVGGGTAATGITLYEDAAVIASTATNQALYVAMEDTAILPYIGNDANLLLDMAGNISFAAVYAANLSLAQHGLIKTAVNTYFGLSL